MKWPLRNTERFEKWWRSFTIALMISAFLFVLIYTLFGEGVAIIFVPPLLVLMAGNFFSWTRRLGRSKPPKPAWKGICEWCGYDMRATLDRCPECGKLPTDPANRADIADYKQSFRKLSTERLESLIVPDTALPLVVQAAARELLLERKERESQGASQNNDTSEK